jgi:hypothetical protein
MKVLNIAAGVALGLAVTGPVFAQNADTPVDVTAAPPPSAGTVGPSQLRDFSLDGTVTRPADRSATTAPPPTRSVQPDAASADPVTSRADPATTVTRRATASLPSQRDLAPAAPAGGTAGLAVGSDAVTPAANSVETETARSPAFDQTDAAEPAPLSGNGGLGWPWIAALLALVGGAGFLAWSRRTRRQRYGDPGRMAFAGLVPDLGPEPAAAPPPVPRPRADPVPPRAPPKPPVQAAPKPEPKGSDDGLIVSKRLKPELTIQFQPDRAVVTDSDVMLQFDVVVANTGSAPARDVLVEAQMVCAHAGQDSEIAAFFKEPVGKGDRIAAIQPLGRISLKSSVRVPLAQLHSFEVEGRTLFVPLVAFNILFSGNAQASASFLVGRGTDGDEKLAPFRLDLGPRIFRGLSARAHSMGLNQPVS